MTVSELVVKIKIKNVKTFYEDDGKLLSKKEIESALHDSLKYYISKEIEELMDSGEFHDTIIGDMFLEVDTIEDIAEVQIKCK